jgi:hypothetical protein
MVPRWRAPVEGDRSVGRVRAGAYETRARGDQPVREVALLPVGLPPRIRRRDASAPPIRGANS